MSKFSMSQMSNSKYILELTDKKSHNRGQNHQVILAENIKSSYFYDIPVHFQFDSILLNKIHLSNHNDKNDKKCLVLFLALYTKLSEKGKIIFIPIDETQRNFVLRITRPFFICTEVDDIYVLSPRAFKKTVGIYVRWMGTAKLLSYSLIPFFLQKGYMVKCYIGPVKSLSDTYFLQNCNHMFMWNSYLWRVKRMKNLCDLLEIDYSFVESGWLKEKFIFIDRKGVKSESSLTNDNLEWVKQEHVDIYNEFSSNLRKKYHWLQTNKYILCVLEGNRLFFPSQFKKNQDFINYLENKHPDKQIVFKLHPYGIEDLSSLKISDNNILTKGEKSFCELAQDAELVYGINSKALFESIMMGVPTIGLGELFLNHAHQPEKLAVAYVSRLIKYDEKNLDEKFANIGLYF